MRDLTFKDRLMYYVVKQGITIFYDTELKVKKNSIFGIKLSSSNYYDELFTLPFDISSPKNSKAKVNRELRLAFRQIEINNGELC